MTFRIAQISDTHLSAAKPFFLANFDAMGEELRSARPDLVLNSGDISLDGAAEESDLVAARRRHDALGLDVRFIPGNHDLGDNVDAPLDHQSPVDEARRARYGRHFGEDWWCFDVPGWRVLGLNAQLLGSGLASALRQDAFLAGAVSETRGRAIALFLHKPLFDLLPAETAIGGRFLNPAPRRALLQALGEAPPALVACGHVHQHRDAMRAGVRHVWAPSTAFVLPDRFQPRYGLKRVGYVEHRLHADGTHDSRFVQPPGMRDLSIADFPEAYGELPELLSAANDA